MKAYKIFLFFILISFSSCTLKAEERHKVIVCEHGLETLAWMIDLIGVAEQSIEMAAPFLGGEVGCQILKAMTQRMQEQKGLHIHLLIHPLFLEGEEKQLLSALCATYPDRFHVMYTAEVPITSPVLGAINNHMKLFIVDENYFIVGGTNFDDYMCTEGTYKPTPVRPRKNDFMHEHLPSGGRDSDVVCQGGCAQQLRKVFYDLYALWAHFDKTKQFNNNPSNFSGKSSYFPLAKKWVSLPRFEESKERVVVESVKMCFSGPMDKPNKIEQEYLALINGAKESIMVGNLYFHPTQEVYNAFMKAVNRGVSFTYIGNGINEGVTPKFSSLFCWANRVNYVPIFYGRTFRLWEEYVASSLLPKKVRFYEYDVEDILYHKKTMIVDGRYLIIGSFNLGLRSAISDYELVLIIDSEEVAKKQRAVLEKDIELSRKIDIGEARGWYFDPWTLYMAGIQKQVHVFI